MKEFFLLTYPHWIVFPTLLVWSLFLYFFPLGLYWCLIILIALNVLLDLFLAKKFDLWLLRKLQEYFPQSELRDLPGGKPFLWFGYREGLPMTIYLSSFGPVCVVLRNGHFKKMYLWSFVKGPSGLRKFRKD